MPTFATETDLDRFIEDFEAGIIPKPAWTHAAHLAIGACYALAYPEETQALARLRTGIRHLNDCQGVANTATGGYHETLTRFWLAIVRAFVQEYRLSHPDGDRLSMIRAVMETFTCRRDLFREYYSFDVVGSSEARRSWIAPDRQPLICVLQSS